MSILQLRRRDRSKTGPGRSLHVVDLDSLVDGIGRHDYGHRAREAIARYRLLNVIEPLDDAVLVGIDAEILMGDEPALAFRRLPSGEVLTFCDCALYYDRVVVATDDARFRPVLGELARHGVHVVVATTRRRPCRSLASAADETLFIPHLSAPRPT